MLWPAQSLGAIFNQIKASGSKTLSTLIVSAEHDVDSVCATAILMNALESENIQSSLITVNGGFNQVEEELRRVFETQFFRNIILINCGAMVDLNSRLHAYLEEDTSPFVFVIDSHRPIAHQNLLPSTQRVIVLGGEVQTLDGIPLHDLDELEVDESEEEDFDDEDEIDENSTQPPPIKRLKREGRKERAIEREAAIKQYHSYYSATYLGDPSSHVMFQMVSLVGKESNDLIWSALVGVMFRYVISQDMDEETFQFIQNELASELLEKIRINSWQFFEDLVVDLMIKMGYGGSKSKAGKSIQRTNDEGIDGIINEDKLGLDVIYLQAKMWQNETTISRPEVQKFVGALHGKRAKKGVFITTSSFTKGAIEYVKTIDPKVILIDGQTLTNLMIEHNVGTTVIESYQIKKIDLDYFEK